MTYDFKLIWIRSVLIWYLSACLIVIYNPKFNFNFKTHMTSIQEENEKTDVAPEKQEPALDAPKDQEMGTLEIEQA